MHHTLSATRRVALAAAAAALALGVAGCGTTSTDSSGSAGSSTTQESTAALTLEDGWVKAVEVPSAPASMSPSGESEDPSGHDGMSMPMTAVFGTLRNTTDGDVTVTGGSSPVARTVELHETVMTDSGSMQMQPKPGGFVVPAGGDHTLQPGGDHVMLLGLTQSLPNGTETTVTLETSAGEVSFTVPVRTFPGAQESYVPSPGDSSS